MTAAGDALATYVGVAGVATEVTYIEASASEAAELVTQARKRPGVAELATVPAHVLARAELEVGADLYWRKASRNGVATTGQDATGTPIIVRINRDPMTMAWPLLRPFIGPNFG